MFKAEYQTPLRCHTVEQLLEFPLTPKTKDVDLFLFLIDAYDITYARLEPPYTNTKPFEQLTLKLRTFLMYNYDKLKVLKKWIGIHHHHIFHHRILYIYY